MAKEKFKREQPHANIDTIGHVPDNSSADQSQGTQVYQSDLAFLKRLAARNGFLVVIIIAIGALIWFGSQTLPSADAPTFQPALITEIGFPAAHITLERGYTAQDDLWKWAALECVPDYAPLAHTACLETDTILPFILGRVYNDISSPICQTPVYALDPDHADLLPDAGAQSEQHFFTIQLQDPHLDSVRLPTGDSSDDGGSDVAIDTISLTYESIDISSNTGQIPFILVLYDTAFPTFQKGGEIVAADFNYEVMVDSAATSALSIEPQVDPESGDVVGPTLALIAGPDGPQLIDLTSEPQDDQGTLLALMRMVPSSQLFPPHIPPLCSTLLNAPSPETEEPTEEPADESASSVPVSTEEPVEQQPAVCGDLVCDTSVENTDLCPADCQCVDDGVCAPGEGDSCQDCGSSAGFCGAICADSSQCAAGLACAGGVCWDALTCGSAPGGNSGGSGGDGGGGSCGYGECNCKPDVREEHPNSCTTIYYDSCENSRTVDNCP